MQKVNFMNTKTKLILHIIVLVMGLGGFISLWIFSDWKVAVGVFLCIFSNNIQQKLNRS